MNLTLNMTNSYIIYHDLPIQQKFNMAIYGIAVLDQRRVFSILRDPEGLTRKVSSGSDGCNKPSAVVGGNQPAITASTAEDG